MNKINPLTNAKDMSLVNPREGEVSASKSNSEILVEALGRGKERKYARFVMAALGSVPWIAALASLSAEKDQEQLNLLLKLWVQEQQPKLEELKTTLSNIIDRLDRVGDETRERVESPEYLALVRRAFRSWDEADTSEKREYIKRLISNAGISKLCSDDLVRLFITWIDTYHESHFAVIKAIYQNPGITRGLIWDSNNASRPRDDSSEADLFRYLIRDLSLSGVIRQEKARTEDGQFMKKTPAYTPKGYGKKVMESAFEDTKPYALTDLGSQFVHYVLSDAVKQIDDKRG